MNKRRIHLKESKLSKIIQESIRRVLNESDHNGGESFLVNNARFIYYKVSYDEEEGKGKAEHIKENLGFFKAKSVKDIISKLAKDYGFNPKKLFLLDNEVSMSVLVDEKLYPLTDSEIEQWKRGEIEAYNYVIFFTIAKQTELSHDELLAAGLKSYI